MGQLTARPKGGGAGRDARAASDLQTRVEADLLIGWARRRSLGETFRAIFGPREPDLFALNDAEAVPGAAPEIDLSAREKLDPGALEEVAAERDRRFEVVGLQSDAAAGAETLRFSVRVD